METKIATLLFLQRRNEILLAMKKRGFGAGRWNGVGGKVESGETIEQALVRECREEISVTPLVYHKVAEHEFTEFHDGAQKRMLVQTFLCSEWEGEPAESEEMAPQWFNVSNIPYEQMWSDDPYWLPQILGDKKVRTHFVLDEHDKLVEHVVTEVAAF
jgi:mutator protein MutT